MKRRRCQGIAAVEAALLLMLLALLMVKCLSLGRLALGGAALDRAASNAARYLATVPVESLHNAARLAVVEAVARNMIEETLANAGIDAEEPQVYVKCGGVYCADLPPATTPTRIGVVAIIQYQDLMFASNVPAQLSVEAEVGRGN
jgi:Flp pilus assembly protein TadG